MRKRYGRLLALWSLAAFLLAGLLSGCGAGPGRQNDRKMSSAAVGETEGAERADAGKEDTALSEEDSLPEEDNLPEDGSYTSKEDVALYLYTYGHLPDNFIRKDDAKKLGWDNSKGNLAEVAPGKSIGGDRFGNYEGLLPEEDGRKWTECDIGYEEGYRTGERIVFSNDGLIYYTGDHYKSFERLY